MDDGKMPGEDDVNVSEMTVGQLKTHVDARFEQVDRRFGQVDERFEQVDKRFEQVDRRFDQVDKRFEQVDKRFDQVDKRFDQVLTEFDKLKRHTSTLFESLRDDVHKVADGVAALWNGFVEFRRENAADHARFDSRLDDHEARITRLEGRKRRSRA